MFGTKQYTTEPYECFVSDPNRKNRYFKLDYSIFLPEYSDVNIKCEIDGIGVIYEGSENKDIPIERENCEIFINNEISKDVFNNTNAFNNYNNCN